jgi:hypothetical protein
VITHIAIWYKQLIAGSKSCVCKIVFSRGYVEVPDPSIVIDLSISCRPLPTTQDIEKRHIECASNETVLSEGTLSIASSITTFVVRVTRNMSAIDSADGVSEVGIIFWILKDLEKGWVISSR